MCLAASPHDANRMSGAPTTARGGPHCRLQRFRRASEFWRRGDLQYDPGGDRQRKRRRDTTARSIVGFAGNQHQFDQPPGIRDGKVVSANYCTTFHPPTEDLLTDSSTTRPHCNCLARKNIAGSYTRPPLRGHFQPLASGPGTDTDFYIYSTHLRADGGSCGSSCDTIRGNEAAQINADADALGQGENVLIVGDFNMKTSSEPAYANLTASGPGQVHDPINMPGSWFNNNSFKSIHTQNPGGAGGMDDRFDLQFSSDEVLDPGGLEYIVGSYRAFGNNGTHTLNGSLTSGSQPANVLTALRTASDHLPVVADYDLGSLLPDVRITETGNGTVVTEGGVTDTYSVVLTTVPTSNVTITLNIDSQLDAGAGVGNSVNLVFTPQNALTPQVVTVTAADDTVVEPPLQSTITHSSASSDSDYNTLPDIEDVVVSVTDNDTQVVISELMYNPASDETPPGKGEWIEVVNTSTAPIDLSSWKFDDEDQGPDDDWGAIPNGTVLGVDQVAVFFDSAFVSESDFRSAWNVPAEALVVGISWGDLSNDPNSLSEQLQLLDSLGTEIDFVNYDDSGTWPSDEPEGASIFWTIFPSTTTLDKPGRGQLSALNRR